MIHILAQVLAQIGPPILFCVLNHLLLNFVLVIVIAAIPVLASNLKSASICIYLEQVKRDGNPLGPLWSQGQEVFQWQRTSSYRQTSYSH